MILQCICEAKYAIQRTFTSVPSHLIIRTTPEAHKVDIIITIIHMKILSLGRCKTILFRITKIVRGIFGARDHIFREMLLHKWILCVLPTHRYIQYLGKAQILISFGSWDWCLSRYLYLFGYFRSRKLKTCLVALRKFWSTLYFSLWKKRDKGVLVAWIL